MSELSFIPFDITCYNDLEARFRSIFEPELINEICKSGQIHSFDADEVIVDVGMLITHMPLVIEGSIKVLTEDSKGDELLLYYLELGDTCAVTLNCCTRMQKSSIRAIAETKVQILMIPVEKMEEWMQKYKSWRTYVLQSYNERLNEMVSAIDNVVFHSLEERLRQYLKDKVWITKSATLHISHQEIANELYSSRVVISRLMKKLENENVIKQMRNRITVLEYDKS